MGKPASDRWGGVSSGAVKDKTGKGWNEWFVLLDREGASKLPHREIAKLLHTVHGVPSWWAQTVTVGYEQARGLRAEHEKPGGFEASASKTFNVPAAELFRHFNEADLRPAWLGGLKMTIRKATEPKSIRATWADSTNVGFYFTPKGGSKSAVQIQHGKLKDEADVQARKAFWQAALARLAEAVGETGG